MHVDVLSKFYICTCLNGDLLACRICIFLDTPYQNGKNIPITIQYTKCPQNIPNGYKIYTPTSSIASSSKIYPNLDVLLENIPSGNPVGMYVH
jgi:hypothetical protein